MPCQVKRGDGLGDVVTAALYKEAIDAGVKVLEDCFREANITVAKDNVLKIVLIAQQVPYMSPDMRDRLFRILVNRLKTQAQVGEVSPYDLNQIWLQVRQELGPDAAKLPNATDPRVKSLFEEVLGTLAGYGGQLDPHRNKRPSPKKPYPGTGGPGPGPGIPPGV